MNVNVDVAKKALEDLRARHQQDLNNVRQTQARLEEIRVQAKMVEDLADKHNQERIELQGHINELGRKVNELEQLAAEEREKARSLYIEHHHLQQGMKKLNLILIYFTF